MQTLTDKVQKGKLVENDARLQLAQALNKLRKKQQVELQQLESIDNQRRLQTFQMMNHNSPYQLEFRRISPIDSPVRTNCQSIGNQLQCTSY